MQKLLDGLIRFRKGDYETHRQLFMNIGDAQRPHTLFIACSDSRIDPNMITGTLPGELFIIRNIANLVPPWRETSEFVATTSAIEYAVLALGVENIIVCGHSNCGGCAASLNPANELSGLPHTRHWLELIHPVRDRILREIPECEPGALSWMMEQANAVEQARNLLSYPYIRERAEAGKLQISAWYYIIETGEIFIYDTSAMEFKLANGKEESIEA